jgi:hypothetical protein
MEVRSFLWVVVCRDVATLPLLKPSPIAAFDPDPNQ